MPDLNSKLFVYIICRLPASSGSACLFSFAGVVLEQLLDQIDVGKDHAAAAVALETDAVERFSFFHAVAKKSHVFLPKVSGDLAARKATDRNNHFEGLECE